jgi:ATP-dependent RNA helicase DDX19/DBP5
MILNGLYSMNFKKPSKIQEKALPLLLSNPPTNMIAQSQSGTGKTAAFVITILSRLDYTRPHQPQALCLAPSRELARQIEGVVRTIGQFVEGLTIQAAVPGAVERNAKVQAMVVVGTPGTVMDLIKRRQFDTSNMKVLCLDEADNMLDQQGLGDQCLRVKQLVLQWVDLRASLTIVQDAAKNRPDPPLLSHLPRWSYEICTAIQSRCERNQAEAG